MSPEEAKAARALLAFYLEAGADAFLGEEPINRLAEPEPRPSPARPMVRDAGLRPVPHHEAPRYEAPRPRQQTPPRPEEPAAGGRLDASAVARRAEAEGRAAPATPAPPEAAIMDAGAAAGSGAQ